MASSALKAFDGTMFIDTLVGPAKEPVMADCTADCLRLSPGEGLKAAKGALTAISLDVAAVFFLFGIWQVWRLFR